MFVRVCRRDILRLHGCCRHGHSVSTFRLAAVMVVQAALVGSMNDYEGTIIFKDNYGCTCQARFTVEVPQLNCINTDARLGAL